MKDFLLPPGTLREGVYYLSGRDDRFESLYLAVRAKENRICSPEEALLLPFASAANPHRAEWRLRTRTFHRFQRYLASRQGTLNILDLGCGNGWFARRLSASIAHRYYCADINAAELTQGAALNSSETVRFLYADIFRAEIPPRFFDLITLNASAQYFPDIGALLTRLALLLASGGELHIMDSPWYHREELHEAQRRTQAYYDALGIPEMAAQYHHHAWEEILAWRCEIAYDPSSLPNVFRRLLGSSGSPFPWIVVRP